MSRPWQINLCYEKNCNIVIPRVWCIILAVVNLYSLIDSKIKLLYMQQWIYWIMQWADKCCGYQKPPMESTTWSWKHCYVQILLALQYALKYAGIMICQSLIMRSRPECSYRLLNVVKTVYIQLLLAILIGSKVLWSYHDIETARLLLYLQTILFEQLVIWLWRWHFDSFGHVHWTWDCTGTSMKFIFTLFTNLVWSVTVHIYNNAVKSVFHSQRSGNEN